MLLTVRLCVSRGPLSTSCLSVLPHVLKEVLKGQIRATW